MELHRVKHCWATNTFIYKIGKRQGPTIYYKELYSISCSNLWGKRLKKNRYRYITESLCSISETNTLQIDYTSITKIVCLNIYSVCVCVWMCDFVHFPVTLQLWFSKCGLELLGNFQNYPRGLQDKAIFMLKLRHPCCVYCGAVFSDAALQEWGNWCQLYWTCTLKKINVFNWRLITL